ncbi:hypothetical protein [Streptomyces benahoarensis]|uniref:Uncharacterized protein n=1 Tax=Streptomyces benahoarensis TaxID=2595054 RepID=A0A553ZMR6_9ACTN|nr:hypothetical protein [Streptomyces benahoarensis]TSB32004.1 hypothetical protein FNJ62_03755 [Streptomyces benahoarensis]TSB42730.1 hypothetical protein FNZ23_08300 [Streptomyces benahoarensis]
MPRGSYGTPMTVFRLPRQPSDPRRQGRCPKCQAMQGERCFDRPKNGVHGERLHAHGIDPKSLPPLRTASRRRRRPKGAKGNPPSS